MINIIKWVLIFAALFAIVIYPQTGRAAEWRTSDTYREVGFQVLNLIDWGQTRYIANNPKQFREVESAWLIGEHPTVQAVDTLMITSAILHPIIAYYLPHGWRDAYQYISIGGKLNATAHNAYIGIKIQF